MIKLVFCMRRRSDLSLEEFSRYWSEVHTKIGPEYGNAMRIHRYVQTHRIDHPENERLRQARGAEEPFDGVAELWWTSEEDLNTGLQSPEGQALGRLFLEDERNFVDLGRSAMFLSEERVFVGAETP